MGFSKRFKQLDKRLKTLRAHFLPAAFSPIGQYTVKEYDFARAYLVLAHAEIEAFIEDRAKERVDIVFGRWNRAGRVSEVIRALIAFHNIQLRRPWKLIDNSARSVRSAVNSYFGVLKNNHGVREENLLKVLFPIGIGPKEIKTTWLATMDSFGVERGSIAHTSIKTQQPIDPEGEFKKIREQVLPGLKRLDRKLSRVGRRV
jgi:hypothetical protein